MAIFHGQSSEGGVMADGGLGKTYDDGDIIVRQGEVGDCMFVIQAGQVEVVVEENGVETVLRTAEQGEFIGEMAIFDREVRSATLRAAGSARLLTIDKKNFLKRIQKDPSLAFTLVQSMSSRVRDRSAEVARLKRSMGDSGQAVDGN
jgi:CRP-like cAMP-binding protein